MARTTKSDEPSPVTTSTNDKPSSSKPGVTSNMHYIVTRNKRNVYEDDYYDYPPTSAADLPVFH